MSRFHTYFMLLKSTARWRTLGPDAQRAALDEILMLIFNGYPALRMSHYAADPQHGRCSDVIVWESADAEQYRAAIDALYEQPFFGAPWFEIVDVVSGFEDDPEEAAADARAQYACVL
ncbi:MAG: darcynin [Proteobacteria bacterium]|nr:darcynin [Pseudomonadota bacterium]